MLGHAVRHAGAVIAVSQKTKEDILEAFHVKEEKVSVVHNGVRGSFRKLADSESVRQFRVARGLNQPFLLFVGNVKPHKNVPALLEAFALVHSRYRDLDLVFAGGDCLGNASLKELSEKLRISNRIRDLHQLEEPELVRAYNAAEAVILPSLYEGFGFPALEAMACGTPAIVSGGGALPEVVGDAAIVVEPANGESLANAIVSLLGDPKKRSVLIEKGTARAADFSWNKVGEQTLAIYERVLEQCR
jgi:glycosyltransferase involved in cell wall biosynthesis